MTLNDGILRIQRLKFSFVFYLQDGVIKVKVEDPTTLVGVFGLNEVQLRVGRVSILFVIFFL